MKFLKIFMISTTAIAALFLALYSFPNFFSGPCDRPFKYVIGRFDPQFGISEEDFKSRIAEAGAVWEKALGRDIFSYDPEASFEVNLIYDERQLATMQKQKTESGLSAAENILDGLDQRFEIAKREYEREKSLYESAMTAFEKKREFYEAEVNKWNAQGGAPSDIYNNLQAKARALNVETSNINRAAQILNAEGSELNALLEERNRAAKAYNQVTQSYNRTYGHGLEFNQAEYTGEKINVYQFGNEKDLLLALAHELGHALGVDHVEEPGSVMYYITGSDHTEGVFLSEADLEELNRVCEKGK